MNLFFFIKKMSCEYNVNTSNCKFIHKYLINNIRYCTRHYNIINNLKKNSNNDSTSSNIIECSNLYIDDTNNNRNNNSIKKNNSNDNEMFSKNNLLEINTNTYELKTIINEFINNKFNENKLNENKLIILDSNIAFKLKYTKENKCKLYYEYNILKNNLKNHINIIKLNNIKENYYYKLNNNYSVILYEPMINYITLNDFMKNNLNKIEDINQKNNIIIKIISQLILAIRYIHKNKYLYLNLNPDNIYINNEYNIKLTDFSICIKYINNNSEFYNNTIINKIINIIEERNKNIKFNSININKGYYGTRCDDIESIFYILIFLYNNNDIHSIYNKNKNIKTIIINKQNILKNNNLNNNLIENFKCKLLEELDYYELNKCPKYINFINVLK